jgi:hypothetical protein
VHLIKFYNLTQRQIGKISQKEKKTSSTKSIMASSGCDDPCGHEPAVNFAIH